MYKLRFAVVLPAIQVVIAGVLLHSAGIPDPTRLLPHTLLICHGLNAPALLSRIPGRSEPLSWVMGSLVLDFGVEDLLFLLGVIVTWYFVGRTLDRRRVPEDGRHRNLVVSVLAHCFLLATAGLLLLLGLGDFRHFDDYLTGRPERTILVLAWSASLFAISGKGLMRVIRGRNSPRQHEHA